MEANVEASLLGSSSSGLPPLPGNGGAAPERRVLGLSGYAGVGKDTVAKMLHPLGYQRLAFFDAGKALAYDLDPAVHDQVEMFGWEQAKKNDYVRRYLQKLGFLARKHLGDTIWIDTAVGKVGTEGNYVFTDVRYINEADRIHSMGGKVVRIERPGHGPVNGHDSEVELDGHQFDGFLLNNGDLNQLFDRVHAVVEELFP